MAERTRINTRMRLALSVLALTAVAACGGGNDGSSGGSGSADQADLTWQFWIGGTEEYDRNYAGLPRQRPYLGIGYGENCVRSEGHKFCCVRLRAHHIPDRPTNVNLDIAVLHPASLAQYLSERRETFLPFRIVRGRVHQHANAPHPLGLLRSRKKRPRNRACKSRNEFASFHGATP